MSDDVEHCFSPAGRNVDAVLGGIEHEQAACSAQRALDAQHMPRFSRKECFTQAVEAGLAVASVRIEGGALKEGGVIFPQAHMLAANRAAGHDFLYGSGARIHDLWQRAQQRMQTVAGGGKRGLAGLIGAAQKDGAGTDQFGIQHALIRFGKLCKRKRVNHTCHQAVFGDLLDTRAVHDIEEIIRVEYARWFHDDALGMLRQLYEHIVKVDLQTAADASACR